MASRRRWVAALRQVVAASRRETCTRTVGCRRRRHARDAPRGRPHALRHYVLVAGDICVLSLESIRIGNSYVYRCTVCEGMWTLDESNTPASSRRSIVP